MPLIALWKSNAAAVAELTIEQIVSTAGDGALRDNTTCSLEIREYVAQVPSTKLATYLEHCLSASFPKGGMVLQDLVNELGRRLDYDVTNGRYQGTHNSIGYDGIWRSPEGHVIVLESKTTDAYRIPLDTLIEYREKLKAAGQISGTSSILIVVGRDDTGELEAQVRGSRHAWDIRLISVDALLKLVQLKENSESPETGVKIRSLLTPMEYTRLDELVDVMFTTATDVESAEEDSDDEVVQAEAAAGTGDERTEGITRHIRTDKALLQSKRNQLIDAVANASEAKLIKKSRALFWDAEHKIRVAATISKRYDSTYNYWYAYHPQWDAFLQEGTTSHFILGGMDIPFGFAIPWKVINGVLQFMNTTPAKRGTYWHVYVSEVELGHYKLMLPKNSSALDLDQFRISLPEETTGSMSAK